MNATTKANLNNLTSNQYYGGLNRRFERRAALLRRLGFGYRHIEVAPRTTIGIFTRNPRFGRTQVIQTGTVHHASNAAWFAELALILQH